MPEILEIEMYRRGAKPIIGRRIAEVDAPDAWFLKGADARSMEAALVGARIATLDRIGKLLLMVTDAGTVGLRFGMTGRLVIDDEPRWLTAQSISELRNGLLPSINGDPDTQTSAMLDSSIGRSLHAEQLRPLGFDEIFFYPGRHAQLVTKRLAKSDTRGLIAIEEYWERNQAGRWELAFKIPSS